MMQLCLLFFFLTASCLGSENSGLFMTQHMQHLVLKTGLCWLVHTFLVNVTNDRDPKHLCLSLIVTKPSEQPDKNKVGFDVAFTTAKHDQK